MSTELLIPGLPDHVHVERLEARNAVTHDLDSVVVVWADGVEDSCPRCGQEILRVIEEPPVMLDGGAGVDGGLLQEVDLKHGCGEWLPVRYRTLDDVVTDEQILTVARQVAADRQQDVDVEAEHRRAELVGIVATALEDLAGGAALDDLVNVNSTAPGLYIDPDGQLAAWNYLPDATGPDDVVRVTAADVRRD
jgi:hypothetical protein